MTEINFVEGGFWAAQWWYNIPPVGSAPAEYDFIWDSTSIFPDYFEGGAYFGPVNEFDYSNNTYDQSFLYLSAYDANNNFVLDDIYDMVEDGDNIMVQKNLNLQ